ncbi:MAG: hypothetical protein K2Z80_09645 [Xanthobacteraceae bacterium]|nr:hypothetical protein [Xanthobacteraceae bacterium]
MIRRLALTAGAVVLSASVGLARGKAEPFCSDLTHVVRLAAGADKFASITGKVREGSFYETSRPLTGWKDCTIYGERTYSCNSHDIRTANAAREKVTAVVRQVKACFGQGWWSQDELRTSPLYVVLHHPVGLATMTVSTDEDRKGVYVLRMTMFLRN